MRIRLLKRMRIGFAKTKTFGPKAMTYHFYLLFFSINLTIKK